MLITLTDWVYYLRQVMVAVAVVVVVWFNQFNGRSHFQS